METEKHPAMTPQQAELTDSAKFGIDGYRKFVVGADSTWLDFLCYEFSYTLLSGLPGLIGYGARSVVYPWILKSCRSRPAIGRGVVVRGVKQIEFGSGVAVDDYAALDVRGRGASLIFGDRCTVGRYTTIAAKGGSMVLGNGVNIGSYCRVATQSLVEIGESCLIAAFCYIGPGNHQRGDGPLISQPMQIKGGVKIGKHVWIGAHSTILDGVSIGDGAIVGAHSLVKEDVPPGATVVGVPAKVI